MPKSTVKHRSEAAAPPKGHAAVTVGQVAHAAGVGVETIRYYQRRGLLAVPHSGVGVRRYPPDTVDRIRFIKHSQSLGFTLDEIAELLLLERGGSNSAIRKIAGGRLTNIREKIAALRLMEQVLSKLFSECEHTATTAPCPIIAALKVGENLEPGTAASATAP
jgi:MerR family mercuric resistance operon transcriptional regulator